LQEKDVTIMIAATTSRRRVIVGASALAVGAAFARPVVAAMPEAAGDSTEPASWIDPAMPEVTHRMIATNGIRLHVAEQGAGPLVILCHGFPECWYSWRHQLRSLAQAGFRAVAPDLRGYGRSDRPDAVEAYTLLHDIGDVVGLLDGLGSEQAVIVGHDVGATVAWQAALLHPVRFRGVVALSVPYRPRGFGGSVAPTSLMPQTREAVFYQLYFQTPEAEAALGRDIRRTIRATLYSLSGDRPPSPTGGNFSGMVPRTGGAFLNAPATSLPSWVTEKDVDVYVEAFTRSGFFGPLGWYRNVDRSWELLAPFADATVIVPALYIAGDRDFAVAVNRQYVADQPRFVPKLQPPIMLPGCGHWTEQERADEVNAALIDFLRRI
jgi:pimeloyl-ACP methyl ester carboxylesterase